MSAVAMVKLCFTGRRAFHSIFSLAEAELLGLLWAVEAMANMKQDRIIFEASFEKSREAILNSSFYPPSSRASSGH
ncbi:hypothetical protein YC2023_106520 [Brassica napus]